MTTDIFSFWTEIKPEQTVHPADRDVLDRVEHNFDLRCLPAAFVGPLRTAPIVLLYLSPGLGPQDLEEARTSQGRQRYVEQREGHAPLPSPDEHSGAWKWWSQRTKAFGPWESLRHKIAVLNIGAYHSKTFESYELLASLPSCRVSLDWAQSTLFPEAIAGRRIVICLRAAQFWGLAEGQVYGKALYAPEVVRSGYMCHGPMREEIIAEVERRLSLAVSCISS